MVWNSFQWGRMLSLTLLHWWNRSPHWWCWWCVLRAKAKRKKNGRKIRALSAFLGQCNSELERLCNNACESHIFPRRVVRIYLGSEAYLGAMPWPNSSETKERGWGVLLELTNGFESPVPRAGSFLHGSVREGRGRPSFPPPKAPVWMEEAFQLRLPRRPEEWTPAPAWPWTTQNPTRDKPDLFTKLL